MKSYAQHTSSKIVNWSKEIDQLITAKGNNLNDEEKKKELHRLSADWTTCPVGQSDVKIPRGKDGEPNDGEPYDKILRILGQQFHCSFVEDEDFENCKSILDIIEQRVQYIVKEEDKKILKKVEEFEFKIKLLLKKIKETKTSLPSLDVYTNIKDFVAQFNGIDLSE